MLLIKGFLNHRHALHNNRIVFKCMVGPTPGTLIHPENVKLLSYMRDYFSASN